MGWIYQEHINETVGWFAERALPDAGPGLGDLPWQIEEMGKAKDHSRWWLVSVDIPTSVRGGDCWLSFRIVEPVGEMREAYVERVRAVRSGRGEHEFDVYVWDDREDMWVTAPDDGEDDA